MATVEKITHEPEDKDSWICVCGNRPADDGFYPCDKNGNEMEPVKGSNWDGLYVCNQCGRIINMDTFEVIGQNPNPKMLS